MTLEHPALLPLTPPEPPPRKREGLLIVVTMLLGAAVTVGALVGIQRVRSGSEASISAPTEAANGAENSGAEDQTTTAPQDSSESPSTDSPATESSPTTLAPAPPVESTPETAPRPLVESVPCPQDLDQVICDAADFVQQTRGRPFKEFPSIELLTDDAFDAALIEDLDSSAEEIAQEERLLKSLGLLDADHDLFESYESLLQSGVVGFYDPETGRLVVRGGEFDLYGQLILVHELVHAFDDQWFELNLDQYEDDAAYGYLAVIEGNARRVENLWRAELSVREQSDLRLQESRALSAEDLNRLMSLPPIILGLQASPYEDGFDYVDLVADDGGEAAVDERLADPPGSSEQVLHPNDSEADLVIVDVEPPAVDGEVLSEGTIGELLTGFWLGPDAARGWGGDRYVVWESGLQTCLRVEFAADSAGDLNEIGRSAQFWADRDPADRTVRLIDSVDRSLIQISGCY